MTTSCRAICFTLAGIGAIAFGSPRAPEEFLRNANRAYSIGDYASAVALCERAEDRATDPGLVAFNKAAALFKLGNHRQAELHYRRCLEDAEGSRLANSLYDLANCLVHQSGGESSSLLAEAIHFYKRCLEIKEIDARLSFDARYNLEVTKLMLQSAMAKSGREEANPSRERDADPLFGGKDLETRRGAERTEEGSSDEGQEAWARSNTGRQLSLCSALCLLFCSGSRTLKTAATKSATD